jgi:hypothetical protein
MAEPDTEKQSPKITGHLTGEARAVAEARFGRRQGAPTNKGDVVDQLCYAWSNEGARPAGLIRSAIDEIERLRAAGDALATRLRWWTDDTDEAYPDHQALQAWEDVHHG